MLTSDQPDLDPAPTAGALDLNIDGDEVTLTGTIKGDTTHRALTPRPWVWSRRADAYVLPRSLTPLTRGRLVERLQLAASTAGVALDVTDTGTVHSEGERRDRRTDRLTIRADRHETAATAAEHEAEARYAEVRRILDYIPMGQPILVGHHSEAGHRAALRRIDRNMRKSVEADREADRRSRLAAGIRSALDRGDHVSTIIRRIARQEAEVRQIDRLRGEIPETTSPDRQEIRHETHDRFTAERARLLEAIEIDKALVADKEASGVKLYGPADFKVGDRARVNGRWVEVKRVSQKSISVATGYSWDDRVPYDRVTGQARPAE